MLQFEAIKMSNVYVWTTDNLHILNILSYSRTLPYIAFLCMCTSRYIFPAVWVIIIMSLQYPLGLGKYFGGEVSLEHASILLALPMQFDEMCSFHDYKSPCYMRNYA